MSATTFQAHPLSPKTLVFLATGLLTLSACASKPAGSPAKQAGDGKHCENPSIECATSSAAAFDKKGRLVAVWNQDGRLYLNHSNDLGQSFSNPIAVTADADRETRPQIVSSKDGAIYLAWSAAGHVHFSRSLDSGRTFSAPLQVNSEAGGIVGHSESIAVNDRSYVYIAWADKRGAVSFAFSSDGGRSFHVEKKIADAASECGRVSLKIDRQKLPVAVWQQASGGHALTHFTGKDQPGPIQRIDGRAEACPHPGPAFAVDPQGDYHLAWFAAANAPQGLYFSGGDGKSFSAPLNIRQSARVGQPDLVADGRSIHVAWTESDGKKTLLLEQDSIDGTSWSASRTLAETEGSADHPSLLAYQGHHYVAWQTQDQGFRLIGLGD